MDKYGYTGHAASELLCECHRKNGKGGFLGGERF